MRTVPPTLQGDAASRACMLRRYAAAESALPCLPTPDVLFGDNAPGALALKRPEGLMRTRCAVASGYRTWSDAHCRVAASSCNAVGLGNFETTVAGAKVYVYSMV